MNLFLSELWKNRVWKLGLLQRWGTFQSSIESPNGDTSIWLQWIALESTAVKWTAAVKSMTPIYDRSDHDRFLASCWCPNRCIICFYTEISATWHRSAALYCFMHQFHNLPMASVVSMWWCSPAGEGRTSSEGVRNEKLCDRWPPELPWNRCVLPSAGEPSLLPFHKSSGA